MMEVFLIAFIFSVLVTIAFTTTKHSQPIISRALTSTNKFIYIVDQYNNRIQRWADGANVGETVAGGNNQGNANNQLQLPFGFFVDSNSSLYIADTNNHRIQIWEAGGTEGVSVAGSGVPGSGTNELNSPNGVFVDSNSSIYIADTNNNRIQKWYVGAFEGMTIAGDGGGTGGVQADKFNKPFGVFVDLNYTIYVCDSGNNRVQMWVAGATEGVTVAGDSGGVAGDTENLLANPLGFYVDLFGNVFVADFGNHRVVKWTPGATQGVVVAGGNGNGAALNQLSLPTGVFVDSDNSSIIISDQNNFRIMKWIAGATEGTIVAGNGEVGTTANQLNYPSACWYGTGPPSASVTPSSSPTSTPSISSEPSFTPTTGVPTEAPTFNTFVYVLDQYNNRIQKWSSGATEGETVAGGNGQGGLNNQLNLPFGFFVDSSASIYIADTGNHRIQKWDAGANYASTVAGTSEVAGLGPSELNSPNGVFIDSVGSIYVADTNNNRIQKWFAGATEGVTVAGDSSGVAGTESNKLNTPLAIWLDTIVNTLYVCDTNNNRIQMWFAGATQGVTVAGDSGGIRGSAVNKLDNPLGLYVDVVGNVYVADFNNDRVVKWTPGATQGVVVAGGNGYGAALNQFRNPTGVFVNSAGDIYVTDQSNYRIMKWIAGAAEGSVVAGDGTQGGSLSQLLYPSNCWVGTGIPSVPTARPSSIPSVSLTPSALPTWMPSRPTSTPTFRPTKATKPPTYLPSFKPTIRPTSIVSNLLINQQFLNLSCSVCQSVDGKEVVKKTVSDATNCPINTIVILSVVCPSSVASSLSYKSKYHWSLDSNLNRLQINYKILLNATQNSTTILQLLSNALKSGDFTSFLISNAASFALFANFSNVISIESFTSSVTSAINNAPTSNPLSSAANGSTTNIGLIAGVSVAAVIIIFAVTIIYFYCYRNNSSKASRSITEVMSKKRGVFNRDDMQLRDVYNVKNNRDTIVKRAAVVGGEEEKDSQVNVYTSHRASMFGVVSTDLGRHTFYRPEA